MVSASVDRKSTLDISTIRRY